MIDNLTSKARDLKFQFKLISSIQPFLFLPATIIPSKGMQACTRACIVTELSARKIGKKLACIKNTEGRDRGEREGEGGR